MHGLPGQSEFEHRAIVLDEARVRLTDGSRELRLLRGHLLDRRGHEIDERTRLGHERICVRRLPLDMPADMPRRRVGGALLDQHLERSLAVTIIEADIEARARLA